VDKYLSLDYAGDNSQLSKVLTLSKVIFSMVIILTGPDRCYSIISTLKESDEVTFDDGFIKSEWQNIF
jgi:hypothetical protein